MAIAAKYELEPNLSDHELTEIAALDREAVGDSLRRVAREIFLHARPRALARQAHGARQRICSG